MNGIDQYSVARIIDRTIIQDVLFKWCRAIDRLDMGAIHQLFHPDAVDNHGPYKGGIEGLAAWIGERHKTIPFAMHQLSNILIEFASEDVALVETTICSIQRYSAEGKDSLAQLAGGHRGTEGAGADSMGSARYIDRFERRNGEWRIARRTVVAGWRRIFDVALDAPEAGPEWVVQTRDASDLIFRERAELGIP